MVRILSFLAAVLSIAVAPALADVVDVTVNGTVSASGTISAVCALSTPGCVAGQDGAPPLLTTPFSFSASDTQLGSFTQSWSATNPILGSLQPSVSETTSLCIAGPSTSCPPGTGDTLDVELSGAHSGVATYYSTQETEDMPLSFQLTDPSEVTLYSSLPLGSGANGGEILYSTGMNVLLQVPVDGAASMYLAPGDYELYASVTGSATGSFLDTSNPITDSTLYLTAQFTPVVPEPRGVFVATMLCALIRGGVVSRRKRTC